MLKIRIAKLDDEKQIAKLIAMFRCELKSLKGIEANLNITGAQDEFKEYMNAKYPIFVAANGNNLIGYLVCKIENGVVWAEYLFVEKKYRRCKVATKLYKKAEKLAESLGNDTVYNWVHPNNDKMINFLSNIGYNVLNLIEIRKAYKDEKLNRIINIDKHDYLY